MLVLLNVTWFLPQNVVCKHWKCFILVSNNCSKFDTFVLWCNAKLGDLAQPRSTNSEKLLSKQRAQPAVCMFSWKETHIFHKDRVPIWFKTDNKVANPRSQKTSGFSEVRLDWIRNAMRSLVSQPCQSPCTNPMVLRVHP